MALKPELLSKKSLALYRAFDHATIEANGGRMRIDNSGDTFYTKVNAAVSALILSKVDKDAEQPLKPCLDLIGQTITVLKITIYPPRISDPTMLEEIEQDGDSIFIKLNRGYQKGMYVENVILDNVDIAPAASDPSWLVIKKLEVSRLK